MALWPHVTEVKVLRAKVYTVPAKPGQSGSDRVNPRPRPEDCPCSGGPGAPRERLCFCACAVPRGRVGLRNGGFHVLRPTVGCGRPEEPPAAGYAASRRPGKSALFALASGGRRGKGRGRGPVAGLSAALPRPGCLAVLGGCGPGLRAGALAACLCSVPRPLEARLGVLAGGLARGSLSERSQRRLGPSLLGANAFPDPFG